MTDTKETGLPDLATSLTPNKSIPDALQRELTRMRRKAEAFSVGRMVKCSLGCGKAKAYSLKHVSGADAGTWCLTHGWLSFESVAFPPTERLTASEIEDRRLDERRKADHARRKQAT